ncbi:hypothetical protein TREES_T100004293 [Tupaia chinensis]|uniref:DUF4685 domain-containing protein n=1 Tax=Tupaia chinensis TaxID=246437 RepID=L9KLI2_TUPCH|nr:hypothetical protein TREES_T100004293 [Tupaia chinensis]
MFRRLRRPWAQEVAPKGLPGDRELRRREPRMAQPGPPTPPGSPSRSLPALPTVTGRAKQSRSVLKSLLLPPLCPTRTPRGSARRCPGLAECEVPPGGSGKEAPDFLGALLGELLPSRFREFLQQLQEKCLEPPEPQPRGPPKLKAVLIRSSSGEGSGPRRRCCPFRVRFADETLRDTALRYWERSCAVRQNILEDQTTSQPTVSERVCGSFGRWLESLPGAPNLRTKEAVADPSCWDSPHLPTRRLQDLLSEGALRTAACPSSLGPPPQGSRGDLRTFLDIHSLLESRSWGQKLESSLPDLVLQSVLKRGRPKGYGS